MTLKVAAKCALADLIGLDSEDWAIMATIVDLYDSLMAEGEDVSDYKTEVDGIRETLKDNNMDPLKKLAILLLEDEQGITEDAYAALLDILPEKTALELNKWVKATEGRFYLPEDHGLEWAS